MKIAIVGCGAMGSIYAALFSSAGHEVIAVDANRAHVQAINERGLRVEGASGDRTVFIEAFEAPPQKEMDLVICAVKARFVEAAAGAMKPMLGAKTVVLTIQNGFGSAEVVAAHVGAERLMVGVAQGFGASLPEPGHAHHNAMKAIRIGAHGSVDAARVEAVASAWAAAGFDAAPVADIAAMQWEKLICNVAYSGPCAVVGLPVGEVMNHPQAGRVSRAAAREAFDVSQALGVSLPFEDPVARVQEFAAGMPAAKPSVLLDLEAGRASEIGVINGAVPVQARKAGRQAPVNEMLTALVLTLEDRP